MFKGSMVAMATPMKDGVAPDSEIDFDGLARLIEFHIEHGTDAIVTVGTTGESATLSEKEHSEVIRQVVKMAGGRVPVIAGTGANSTTEALHLTECARVAGADACLLVTPYYNKPTQEGLFQHYKVIAKSVDIPQILYNVPGRTACDMQTDTVARLAEFDTIIGIKEATAELERLDRLRGSCPDDFLILSGDDPSGKDFLLRGGDGVISVTANIAPKQMHEMCVCAMDGKRDAATVIDERLVGLHEKLFIESNPIPVKWALYRMGLIQPGIRLPLTWLSELYHQQVEQAMHQANIL